MQIVSPRAFENSPAIIAQLGQITALAERLDMSRQTVHAIEKGKFDPSLPLAFRAARLFGLRIEDVFDDESGP